MDLKAQEIETIKNQFEIQMSELRAAKARQALEYEKQIDSLKTKFKLQEQETYTQHSQTLKELKDRFNNELTGLINKHREELTALAIERDQLS